MPGIITHFSFLTKLREINSSLSSLFKKKTLFELLKDLRYNLQTTERIIFHFIPLFIKTSPNPSTIEKIFFTPAFFAALTPNIFGFNINVNTMSGFILLIIEKYLFCSFFIPKGLRLRFCE